VDFVSTLTNLNQIFSLSELKKEKSINVPEHILVNTNRPMKAIFWPSIKSIGITSMLELLSQLADWTVRIWDSQYKKQVMCFDLAMIVQDAVWAPYSSSVFACATLDKVYVYDLEVDKHGKLAESKPVK